jgi:hypothetical protein
MVVVAIGARFGRPADGDAWRRRALTAYDIEISQSEDKKILPMPLVFLKYNFSRLKKFVDGPCVFASIDLSLACRLTAC